ncbi:hypothetical protein RJT34_06824 [Clitoria ternatea]|uniref:Uncharacterized protein n=1 Tax=Clitoria ternatea TaxID=43366 RepID=A0AAN9PTR1_CLITE
MVEKYCALGNMVVNKKQLYMFTAYREELDLYRTLPSCACGIVPNFNDIYDTDHLMDFLQSLNHSSVSVRSHILLMDHFPQSPEHILISLQEERQCSLSDSRFITLDQSTMSVKQSNPHRGAHIKS